MMLQPKQENRAYKVIHILYPLFIFITLFYFWQAEQFREVDQVTELEKSIKILTEHTQHYIPTEDLEHLYAVIEAAEKLAEYKDAEEEGRLVVLPCKVGDAVYVIEDSHIEVFEVNKIELKHKVFGDTTYYLEKPSRRGCLYKYYDSEFGVKWFVDTEKAEKALKEMEEKHE